MEEESNEKDSLHWLIPAVAMQNVNFDFNQSNETICSAELNIHMLFFPDVAKTQRLHMEQMC